MSGRGRSDLAPIAKLIPTLGISAENGCYLRLPNRQKWEVLFRDHDLSWRSKVLEVFEYYHDRTHGSFIENKEINLAWHYGMADPVFGSWQGSTSF